MSERQTVAAIDAGGKLCWFSVSEAQQWPATTLQAGVMYRVAEKWVLLPPLADLIGERARIIDDAEALSWFLSNGYTPPGELATYAESSKMR